MKNVAKVMAIRMAVYALLVGYLVFDLFFWQGPIHSSLNQSPQDEPAVIAEAKAEGVVARVYYRPIYRRQVEESLKEFLWRRGRTLAGTSRAERRTLRLLIVNQLIDDELVKMQIKVSTAEEVAVSGERIDEAVAIEMSRYPDEEVFDELARRAGWAGQKELRMRIAARIQRADHLTRMVAAEVGDEEVAEWFAENRNQVSGSLEDNREAIRAALLVQKKDEGWTRFRRQKLRRYARGKIDLFEDVLFAETGQALASEREGEGL
jgi:hypothetical protein